MTKNKIKYTQPKDKRIFKRRTDDFIVYAIPIANLGSCDFESKMVVVIGLN